MKSTLAMLFCRKKLQPIPYPTAETGTEGRKNSFTLRKARKLSSAGRLSYRHRKLHCQDKSAKRVPLTFSLTESFARIAADIFVM